MEVTEISKIFSLTQPDRNELKKIAKLHNLEVTE